MVCCVLIQIAIYCINLCIYLVLIVKHAWVEPKVILYCWIVELFSPRGKMNSSFTKRNCEDVLKKKAGVAEICVDPSDGSHNAFG